MASVKAKQIKLLYKLEDGTWPREKWPEEGRWRPIPAVNIVEVGEEKDSTDEESDQHESPIHFVK